MSPATRAQVDPKIKRRADEILRKSGSPRLENGIGIDVTRIVRSYYHFNLAFIPDLNLGGRRLLAAYLPEYHYVLVEKRCLWTRQRFSIVHELGHAELEDDFGSASTLFAVDDAFLCADTDADDDITFVQAHGRRRRCEIRANQFATFVLMPDELVREVWRSRGNIRSSADALGVSMEALRYRLADLGLLAE
ncbi:MAG: ImmA/IrrE family metallo-endopeptidase [Vulcanimicrobiaceae bacterium]